MAARSMATGWPVSSCRWRVGLPSPSSHSRQGPRSKLPLRLGSRHNTSGEERSSPVWDVDGKALRPGQLF